MTFKRDDRIEALLQQELAALIRTVKDPGIDGLLTVTGVDLSADRKLATAYVSILGSVAARESTMQALTRAAAYLRFQLKQRLSLKVIPNLEFHLDTTAERAQRIESILDKLSHENEAPAPPNPGRGKQSKGT